MKDSPPNSTRMETAGSTSAIARFALGGAVIACILYLLLAFGSLVLAQRTYAQSTAVAAGVRLEAGIEKEDVDGDLKSAMDIYQKIAADDAAPRDVRAKALLRLAQCDEKLGRQAKQIYEQIVHDYADQPAAAQARKQLAMLQLQNHPSPPATLTARKIDWRAIGEVSVPDTDGERTIFEADGNMNIGDLAGKNKRIFFKIDPDHYPFWETSRDLSTVMLGFHAKESWPGRLATVKSDGSGYHEVFRDDAHEQLNVAWGFSVDWSWDNRYLLISNPNDSAGDHIMIVDAADGQRRELVHVDAGKTENVKFSPDGKFAAYEVVPEYGRGGNSSVFVIPVTGGKPREVYKSFPRPDPLQTAFERWTFRDWSSDGRYLLIADTHFGKSALYLLPIKNGVATGPPIFVRYGDVEAGHSTATGAFVYMDETTKPVGADVYITSFDSHGGTGDWKALKLRGGLKLGPTGTGYDPEPTFSPNGSHVAYKAGDDQAEFPDLILRDISSGQEQVLYRSKGDYLECRYSIHLSKIYCVRGKDRDSQATELISIDERSAEVHQLGSFDEQVSILQASLDDQSLYLFKHGLTSNPQMIRWDLSNHMETVVTTPAETLRGDSISSDGQWLLRESNDGFVLRPVSGGNWNALVSKLNGELQWLEFSADSKWILFATRDRQFKLSLYRIPVAGGQPEHWADLPNRTFYTRLYPSLDCSQIIDVAIDYDKYDLWVLENFAPPARN